MLAGIQKRLKGGDKRKRSGDLKEIAAAIVTQALKRLGDVVARIKFQVIFNAVKGERKKESGQW